jgi:hypothetical protein
MARKPTRTAATAAAYLKEGWRHLKRAQKRYPNIADPLEALLVDVEEDTSVLTDATCRKYKQEYLAVIDALLDGRADAGDLRAGSVDRVIIALRRRSGTPEKRTSRLKVTNATEEEALTVLRYVVKRARGKKNAHLLCMLGLFIYLVPRLGCRPVEWCSAQVDVKDLTLTVLNAKATNGRAGFASRTIPLHRFDPRIVEAAALFAQYIPESMARFKDFEHWRNALAELLARCCKASELERRLSLYSFRNVAMATWKKAGATPWEIAALAGHASPRTARIHYAGAGDGWNIDIPAADPERVAALQAAHEQRALEKPQAKGRVSPVHEELAAADDPFFDIAPMPEPAQERRPRNPDGENAWLTWRQRVQDQVAAKAYGSQPAAEPRKVQEPSGRRSIR